MEKLDKELWMFWFASALIVIFSGICAWIYRDDKSNQTATSTTITVVGNHVTVDSGDTLILRIDRPNVSVIQ